MKKLNIVYEDKNLLVINKETKLLTIGTPKEKSRTLYNEVYNYLHKKNQKVFIVNRLDRDTSGLVMFAKNENVKKKLQDNWDKTIRKYYAVVCGKIKSDGKIEEYLIEDSTLRTYSTNDKKNGKLAITYYKPVIFNNSYTLLDIEIKTGRKNQIRVGLSDVHHPIIGDKKYGAKKNPIGRLALHSYYLKFYHPVLKKEIELVDNIPKEFAKIFNQE